MLQGLIHEPRRPCQPVGPFEGGAAEARGGEAARDRGEGATRNQREATGASCPREPAQGDRSQNAQGAERSIAGTRCRGGLSGLLQEPELKWSRMSATVWQSWKQRLQHKTPAFTNGLEKCLLAAG